ncbi:sensor histidine kinase [Mongoliimonas terrestris]|uniref:sensor histidine kinase n=1 Tax=Mongoliimonas terrestris TaxID=1709001 RepID=UPI0009FA54B8|nr:sensor histidine kinase [Mongoliimonas terrestris]
MSVTSDQTIEAGKQRTGGVAWYRRVRSGLNDVPLDRHFAIVGGLVSLVGMLVIGAFVGSRIESAVVRNSAISAAIYMESFIAPLSQELQHSEALSPAARARLDGILDQPGINDGIISIKIWREDGSIAYASDPRLIGRQFEVNWELQDAWAGDLVANFDNLDGTESLAEQALGIPLLEVYNPIHSIRTGEIIAVAEFYQDAAELKNDLTRAWFTSWSVVALSTAVTFAALWGIVRAAHRTIEGQKQQLVQRVQEISHVSKVNETLRARIQQASERNASLNEQFLRRLGSELHDGPAQALAFANLRISAWRDRGGPEESGQILSALEEALANIRHLSRGLILPDLEGKSVAEAIRRVAEAHADRTGTHVTLDRSPGDARPGLPQLICLYRFVQEGLSNAWRHAGGAGQRVEWSLSDGTLDVTVSDSGPGFDPHLIDGSERIGLEALRQRVQSVGGTFHLDTAPGRGTRLIMRLHLNGPSETA